MNSKNSDHYFLNGGGEMGALIRAKDWSKTPLGDPIDWPQSLRTMVAVMLENPFGMYIAWGGDYIQLYNDGYRPILGASKHPHALGNSTRETFSEIWHIIESMFDGVMEGKAVGFPDLFLPLNRNGFVEDCYFDFAYSPIRKDNGDVGGVLVTVIETTEKRIIAEALKESNERFVNNIMQAPIAMCIFRGENHIVEIANEQMLNLWGKQAEQVINKPIFEGLPEAKDQGLESLLNNVFITGEKFVANERPVDLPRNGKMETTYINFVYEALKEPNGKISGVVAIATEVTPQVVSRFKIEESEHKVRAIVENAPFPIAVYVGKEMIVEMANQSIIDLWGKGTDVIGKSFREVLPELDNQSVFEQIQRVLETGESFHTKNTPLDLTIDGKPHTYYFNYSFTPLFDINGNIYGVMNTGVDLTDLNIAKQKVEESEEQIRIAIEGGELGTFDFIPEENQLIWSAKTKEFFGLPLDAKVDYDTYIMALHPDDRDLSRNVAQQHIDLKEDGLYELEYRTIGINDGKLRWLRSKGKATYNKKGEAIRYTGVIQDITKQKESAEKVKESNARFRNTMKQAPVGIIILRGPEYIVELVNDAYLQLVDQEEGEFVGKPLFESLPEVEEAVHGLLDNVLQTGKPYHGNEVAMPVNRYGEQNISYFDFLYHPLREVDGKISGVIATVVEVTEKVVSRNIILERKRLYETITQNTPDLIYVLDLDYRFTYANDALLKMWGRTWDDAIGKNMFEIGYEPWHAEMHEREIDKVIDTKKSVRGEVSFPHANLGKRMYDYIFSPVINEQGEVEAITGTTRDISDIKNAEVELKKSEEQFRLLADSMPQHIWTADPDGNINYYNQSVFDYTGLSLAQINEGGWIQIVHPDDSEENIKQWIHSVSTGKDFIFEHRFRKHDGTYRWQLSRAIPQRDESGNVQMWVGTSTDIQEQKTFVNELEAQVISRTAELKTSEEKFYNLFNLSPIGKTLSDTSSGIIVMINDAFTKLFGYDREMAIGKSSAALGLLDLEQREILVNELKTNGKIENREIGFIKKSGEKFIALVSAELIAIGDSQFFLTAFNDISEIKKAEKNIKLKNIELEKMNKELESFAYISSHDLQEPLRKIQTFASCISEKEEDNLSDSGKHMFNRMQDAAKRMQTLIQDLLAYSRSSTTEPTFKTTDLNEIIAQVKEDLKEELAEKAATIETNQLCEVRIIPFQFQQLMHNLIGNALKFSHPEHPIRIEIKSEIGNGIKYKNEKLAPQKKYCHISVSDNGIGFEPQYSEKIFEVFQRLHAKNQYDGTGIGLSIVKRIIENHKGIVTASGEVNKGATFDIYIPA